MDMHFYWLCDWCQQKNCMFIGRKENTILPTIHQNIILHNFAFQFDQPMYSIPFKNKQKLYLNDQNYQRHCKCTFKHIFHHPLSNRRITNIQCHQCPLCQCWTSSVILHVILLTILKETVQTRMLEPMMPFERKPFVIDETNKYAAMIINIINISTASPMIDSI